MSTDKKETKVKVLTEAEKAKALIDERGLSPAQVADLMVLMAKDIKKNVKTTSKKEAKDPNAPKKEVNSGLKGWLDFTAQVREKVKELGLTAKYSNAQFCSHLKRKGLYPIEELSNEALEEEFEEFIHLSEDDKKAPKEEVKVKKFAHGVSSFEHLTGAKSAAKPVAEVKQEEPKKKVVLKKVKEEVVVRPPEEGTYFKQKIKGVEYLTLAIDGDDLIYVFDINKHAVGAYDVKTKEIDQSIKAEFDEEE